MNQIKKRIQTTGEEIANSITHGVGTIFSIIALCILTVYAVKYGDTWHVVGSTIFGGSLIFLYLSSSLYHSIPLIKAKNVLQRFDHIAIYLLIAGSYTPFALTVLRGKVGWTIFSIEWAMALVGIIINAVWGPKYKTISTIGYVVMGWMAIFIIYPLWQVLSLAGFIWLVLGGLFYTCGVPFYLQDHKIPFFHAIWHLFVLAGSICHFFTILVYIIPTT